MRAGGRHHCGQAKSRIQPPVTLDQQRQATEHAVVVRHGVQKARGIGGLCEQWQRADGAGRAEGGHVHAGATALNDGNGQRVEDAVARPFGGTVERKGIAHDDVSLPQGVGEGCVRVCLSRRVGSLESIGFGKDHVQRDDRGAELSEPRDEARNHVAAPGPLADRREAAFIDVHHRDVGLGAAASEATAAVRRTRGDRAE